MGADIRFQDVVKYLNEAGWMAGSYKIEMPREDYNELEAKIVSQYKIWKDKGGQNLTIKKKTFFQKLLGK